MAERKKTTKKTAPKTTRKKVSAKQGAEEVAKAVETMQPPKPTLTPSPQNFSPAFCVVGTQETKLFGLSSATRIREQFRRAGLSTEISFENLKTHNGPVILVNAEGVLDQPLITALIKRPNLALMSEKETGSKVLAAHVRTSDVDAIISAMKDNTPLQRPGVLQRAPSEMDTNFWSALRKRETPYALPLTADNQSAVEWRMFMGTYKGATDFVTKHLWPVPAFHVTRWLAPRGITPNMVTSVGAIMTVAAFFLFMNGYFAVGLLAAWAMTFLDTVDGKLARTTLTSSKWGDIFDHGIDLIHPPFWYIAWAWGLIFWGVNWSNPLFWGTIAVILGGYVLQRLMEGAAIKWLGLEIHIWRPIDTFFRQVTARRNPNLVLLTVATVVDRPDLGLLAVAAWTGICLLLHSFQLIQGFSAKRTTGALQSWMTKP